MGFSWMLQIDVHPVVGSPVRKRQRSLWRSVAATETAGPYACAAHSPPRVRRSNIVHAYIDLVTRQPRPASYYIGQWTVRSRWPKFDGRAVFLG
jgi:hypothetical protein